jgi:hypothetical protein
MFQPGQNHSCPSSPPSSCEVTPAEAGRCKVYPPALALLIHLRQNFGTEAFPIVPETLAPQLCMSPNTVRKARDFLLKVGLVQLRSIPPDALPKRMGRNPRYYASSHYLQSTK